MKQSQNKQIFEKFITKMDEDQAMRAALELTIAGEVDELIRETDYKNKSDLNKTYNVLNLENLNIKNFLKSQN